MNSAYTVLAKTRLFGYRVRKILTKPLSNYIAKPPNRSTAREFCPMIFPEFWANNFMFRKCDSDAR